MKGLFLLFGLINAQENADPKFTTSLPDDPVTTSATCPNITVLESVTGTDWYDACLGLVKNVTLTTSEACKANCYADMHCSTWQLVNNSGAPHCWSGSVFHGCLARGGADKDSATVTKFEGDLLDGELIQHGFVKVVSTNDFETKGLKHFVEKTGDDATKKARCSQICYTDSTCTVWQYGSDGCWIEHLPTNAAGDATPNSTWSKTMLGGETIEHTCPPYVPEEGLPWPWIIAGIILGLLALGALAYFLMKKPKVKKTRAVKIEPKPAPAPVPLFIPQPTILVPQQSVIMYQAPTPQPVVQQQVQYVQQPVSTQYVTTAAPTTTMATPMLQPGTVIG